jgi:hypothetical protein
LDAIFKALEGGGSDGLQKISPAIVAETLWQLPRSENRAH